MKMGTCADCGRPMHRGTTSLPDGEARCRPCRKANPIRADRTPCVDCGAPCWGERCLPCRAKFQTIRTADDCRVVRQQREHAAPGLNSHRRSILLAKWKRQGRTCAYCPAPADTIDHVVPLVRGGTNYEGNLVPACRKCNGSKAARTIIEWRTGKPSPRMAAPLSWKRKAKPLRIESIKGEEVELFRVCVCGIGYTGRAAYCSSRCHARSAYRLRVGIPLDAPILGDPYSRAERYGMRASA